jgi:hypothetical protein
MATTKNSRLDYTSKLARAASEAFDTLRKLEGLAYDYADLYGSELSADDYAGTALDGIDVQDIRDSVAGVTAISELLSANNGALRKTFKRLAQFNR